MIGQVMFDIVGGVVDERVLPYEQYGLYLVSYDVPPPKPKTYRVTVEGRSGSIDMSEWAGDVFYEDRTVTIKFRDMQGRAADFISLINGQRVKVCFYSEAPDFYYYGRVEDIKETTREHVCNVTMTIKCHPFKYPLYVAASESYKVSDSGMPYTGYYQQTDVTVPNGGSWHYWFQLYQPTSYVEFSVSSDFPTANVDDNNPCKISINGIETTFDQGGIIEVTTPLHKGRNDIWVYNNLTQSKTFKVTVKFKNRVM